MWYDKSNAMNCPARAVLAVLVMLMLGGLAAACSRSISETRPADQMGKPAGDAAAPAAAENPVERGKYLVSTIGCGDCHTPMKMGAQGPEPDMSRMLSGHPEGMKVSPAPKPQGPWIVSASATGTAWTGPWGISYTMNLTPDSVTGIGTWTEDMFMKTLRSGKHWGTSRPIMPPMPWQAISKFTDSDLKAVYAYLRTIPPVKNKVPAYEPPTSGPLAAAAPPPGAPAGGAPPAPKSH